MQLNYDSFTTTNNCKFAPRVQTNPRYKNFTQLYYTVGDVEQFWMAVNEDKLHLQLNYKSAELNTSGTPQLAHDNVFKSIETFVPFEGYKNISEAQVEDTFNYMFHKFKKGIFIKIQNGRLASFVPFSKAFYTNEWSDLIKVDPVYGSIDWCRKHAPGIAPYGAIPIENFFKVHHNLANKLNRTQYKFHRHKINFDPVFWYANNCILRYENPINEGETNYAQIKSMFLELCAERELPDMVFFVNRRDFPLLTRNGTEPYNNIYGDNIPLRSYKFDRYIPILSMCSSDQFADIAIPTHEDWARIKSNEGVFFPSKCRNYTFKFNLKWKTKKNIAVFRGSNTGCGYNSDNNTRLKLAKLGVKYPQFLDVGITNWNLRIRKNKDSEYLRIPMTSDPDLKLVTKLSPEEQSNYKYLINVDGHVSAFRLSLELSTGCCILMVQSIEKWKMWFSDMLEPYVHYVPVKADLTDLIEQIKWCIKNDDDCKKIAQNALKFHTKYLSKKGVLDNLQKTLFELHYQMYGSNGDQRPLDPLLFQADMEHKALLTDNNKIDTYMLTGLFPRNVGRNYGTLKALELFITQSVKSEDSITLMGVEVQTIFKSKTTKVILYQVGAKYIIAKQTINPMKKVEFIHEAFIGKRVMNNMLRSCPNFVFTINYRDGLINRSGVKEATVLQEYVQGPTLQEFLKDCSFKAYLEIILSLSCALFTAQTQCGFVHCDLKPWNVVVNILSEPIVVDYYIKNEGGVDLNYKIKTKYIPVIIDFGKSHVIFNNIHYGIIDPFTPSKTIDLVTLIISSINELMLRAFPDAHSAGLEVDDLIYIANFLSSNKIKNIHELQSFLYKTKKFANLNTRDVSIPENKTFELFFKHVGSLIHKYKISFGKDILTFNVWSSNAKQIADMGFALELNGKINSYRNVVRRMYKTPLPQATNRFATIMIAQKMFEGLTIPKMEFLEFAAKENLDKAEVESVLGEFNKMERFITDFYSKQLNRKVRERFNVFAQDVDDVMNFNIKPTRSLFLSSEQTKLKIVQQLDSLPKSFPRHHYYRSLILDVLRNRGPFKLNDDDKKFYMDNFRIIFDEKFTAKVEDIETIRFYITDAAHARLHRGVNSV